MTDRWSGVRLRRLRANPIIRDLVRETRLSVDDLIYPVFASERMGAEEPVQSMPGVSRWGVDRITDAVGPAVEDGLKAVMVFGIPEQKDADGRGAYASDGVAQRAVSSLKKSFPDLVVITDVCLCEYTDHGHCGIVGEEGTVLNDETLPLLQRIALSHVEAGADMVAPSGMMDGMVGSIRSALDDADHVDTPIMSYAVKYASSFYGPFREAAEGTPQFGDRRGHQMDSGNRKEATREAATDLQEGADILMVKPALAYLDIVSDLARQHSVPVAAYHVSGEYSMVKAAAERGWIDEREVVLELLTGIKRAGANLIVTYHTPQALKWINNAQ
jgi:porphobilinogen synthase